MDTNEVDDILIDAANVANADKQRALAAEIGRLRDHYRKLAEREKALTEALQGMVDYYGSASSLAEPLADARAALALHKEDASRDVEEEFQNSHYSAYTDDGYGSLD